MKCFLSADGRIVGFKSYSLIEILNTLKKKKLTIKRDLPLEKLAPFSLSSICPFLKVKAIIVNIKKTFTPHCAPTPQR